MRTRALALLYRTTLLLVCGCGRVGACGAQQHESARASAEVRFQAPDGTGWGRVEGLRYLEMLQGETSVERALPMVVLIHGLGDKPHRRWLDVVTLDVPARVVMPEAPTPAGEGFSWFPYRVGQNEPHALARGIVAACDQLARALAKLKKERPTLGKPIVTGFSQGGMLSFALALRHADLVQQALPISGGLPEPLWPSTRSTGARSPPIFALHGTADTVVPFEPTQRLIAHLRALGHDARLMPFAGVGHEITPEMSAVIRTKLTAAARTFQ